MIETIRYCPDCGRDRLFEQYHAAGDCPDDPDGCCDEWSCTGCGSALLIGFTSSAADAIGAADAAGGAGARQPDRRVA
jgi:hypothetical protein